jgi:hypothetical protein
MRSIVPFRRFGVLSYLRVSIFPYAIYVSSAQALRHTTNNNPYPYRTTRHWILVTLALENDRQLDFADQLLRKVFSALRQTGSGGSSRERDDN